MFSSTTTLQVQLIFTSSPMPIFEQRSINILNLIMCYEWSKNIKEYLLFKQESYFSFRKKVINIKAILSKNIHFKARHLVCLTLNLIVFKVLPNSVERLLCCSTCKYIGIHFIYSPIKNGPSFFAVDF